MTLEKNRNGTELTMILKGRLDTVTAPMLREELTSNLRGVEKLVLDFAELAYLSSAGLRVLLLAQQSMKKQGEMVIINVNDTVMEIFELTGFSDVLTIR